MPLTSLTVRSPLSLGSSPHYFLSRYQRFGGTHYLYHQNRKMVDAVSLKILIPNYQTARNHTLEHGNLHNVCKRTWHRDVNGIMMINFKLKRCRIWLHSKSGTKFTHFRSKVLPPMHGTDISVLPVLKNSLLKPPAEQEKSNAHQQITLLQKKVIRYHLQKSYLNFPGGESHFSPPNHFSIFSLSPPPPGPPPTNANFIPLIQMMKLLIPQFSTLSSYCVYVSPAGTDTPITLRILFSNKCDLHPSPKGKRSRYKFRHVYICIPCHLLTQALLDVMTANLSRVLTSHKQRNKNWKRNWRGLISETYKNGFRTLLDWGWPSFFLLTVLKGSKKKWRL